MNSIMDNFNIFLKPIKIFGKKKTKENVYYCMCVIYLYVFYEIMKWNDDAIVFSFSAMKLTNHMFSIS